MTILLVTVFFFFFQAEDGIRDAQESRGLGDVYKRQRKLSHIVELELETEPEPEPEPGGRSPWSFAGVRVLRGRPELLSAVLDLASDLTVNEYADDRSRRSKRRPCWEPWSGSDGLRLVKFVPDEPHSDAVVERMKVGADPNTQLPAKAALPPQLRRLIAGLHEQDPEIEAHYSLGWAQVTEMPARSQIPPHRDQPVWGDLIITYTTHNITVSLSSKGKTKSSEEVVRAGDFYVLSQESRWHCKHKIALADADCEVRYGVCLLYTSDAADEEDSVDLGGRRIIKKKKTF
eukprot:TRINITY_DN54758_c0_g1_i1.p1 TRINITY_DN54758_c0_g1~~TRINITY_DN54758_c0_g1_i1.p1  ORF type:complete len:289 (+),score=68.17 TRINITY_DN54758_c0_g1_i1:32-898(+)